MSSRTMEALESAIAAHAKDEMGDDFVVGAWVLGWEASHIHEVDGSMRVCYRNGYAVPDVSPMAVLGIATDLPDLMFGDDDEEG